MDWNEPSDFEDMSLAGQTFNAKDTTLEIYPIFQWTPPNNLNYDPSAVWSPCTGKINPTNPKAVTR